MDAAERHFRYTSLESIETRSMMSFQTMLISAHSNVKAFVTHCGMSGTYETIHAGKPTVMIPVFLDQPSNAAILEKYRVGIYLNILTLNKDKLVRAITTVINDPR